MERTPEAIKDSTAQQSSLLLGTGITDQHLLDFHQQEILSSFNKEGIRLTHPYNRFEKAKSDDSSGESDFCR